jgi:hypothetical protein
MPVQPLAKIVLVQKGRGAGEKRQLCSERRENTLNDRRVERWLSQTVIGYHRTDGTITHKVISARVELTDGTQCDAWLLMPLCGCVTPPTLWEVPRIDVKAYYE